MQASGLQVFIEQKVDVAVLEVGLGGRLDATNCIPSPPVCGVTSLGMDHVEILGDTIEVSSGAFAACSSVLAHNRPAMSNLCVALLASATLQFY